MAERLGIGRGYLELRAGVDRSGVSGVGELGWRPAPWLTTYAEGRVERPWGGQASGYAGLGLRWRW